MKKFIKANKYIENLSNPYEYIIKYSSSNEIRYECASPDIWLFAKCVDFVRYYISLSTLIYQVVCPTSLGCICQISGFLVIL